MLLFNSSIEEEFMEQGMKLWEQTLDALRQELDETDFSVLFSEANKIYKVEDNFIYIIVPNALTKFRIENFTSTS